jgi:hypothetical protein
LNVLHGGRNSRATAGVWAACDAVAQLDQLIDGA